MKNKTGKGILVGLIVGSILGFAIAGIVGIIVGGFLGALFGDTIEEESLKGVKNEKI